MSKLPKLTEMINNSPVFKDPTHEEYEPADRQLIFRKMAEVFQRNISNMYLNPDELVYTLEIGEAGIWEEFLNLEPVQLYIATRTKNIASVNARKSLLNLQKAADKGDVAAIKYLNEVSGILNNQSDNKIIVITTVPRPARNVVQ